MKKLLLYTIIGFLIAGCDWPKEYYTTNNSNKLTKLVLKSDSTFVEYYQKNTLELKYSGTWHGTLNENDTLKLIANTVNDSPLSELITRKLIFRPETLILVQSEPWEY